MTHLRAILVLAVAAACVSTTRPVKRPADKVPGRPEIGRLSGIQAVHDRSTNARLGFLQEYRYDSGRKIWWVYGPDRRDQLGWIDPRSFAAYKLVWLAGATRPKHERLPTDDVKANLARIMEHRGSVYLAETSVKALAEEFRTKHYGAKEKGLVGGGDGGDGCGCGCGE